MDFKLYDEDWKKEVGMGIGIVCVAALIFLGISNELAFRNDMKDVKEQVTLLTKDYAKQTSELKQAIKDRDYSRMAEDALIGEIRKLSNENNVLKVRIAKYESPKHRVTKEKSVIKKKKLLEIGTIRENDGGSITGAIARHIAEDKIGFKANKNITQEEAVEQAKKYAENMGFIRKSEDNLVDNELLISNQCDDNIAVIPVKHSSSIVNGFAFYVKNNGIFSENPAYTFMLSEKESEGTRERIKEFELHYANFETTYEEEVDVATFNIAPTQPITKITNTVESKSSVKCYKLGCLGGVPEIIPSINMNGVKALSSAPQQ